MSETKDGGPAFPGKHPKKGWNGQLRMEVSVMEECGGMSLRDWFAGQALPSVMVLCQRDTLEPGQTRSQLFAQSAYRLADAMLATREASQ